MKISVVIPCYNSEKNLVSVLDRAKKVILTIESVDDYEFVLVNDQSKDNTEALITKLASSDSKICAVCLAKNVGQQGALMAGFNYANGDVVVTLDDDGQTPVEELPRMFNMMDEGYDVVAAHYVDRGNRSKFRNIGSKVNSMMVQWLIERPKGLHLSGFLIMKKFIVDELIKYKNPYPYINGLILRTTYNIGNIEMVQGDRMTGHSGYSFKKLVSLWANGVTAFSIKPLRLATFCGILSAGIGALSAVIIIIRKLFFSHVALGWSSIIAVLLLLGGIILFVLGIMGEYIGRIYICLNETPQYVIKQVEKKDE